MLPRFNQALFLCTNTCGIFELQGEYHMYVAQTPHIDPLMFHLALQQNAETDAVDGAEKTAFAWYAVPAKLQFP